MSLLGRIIVILAALTLAILVAGAALALGVVAPDWAGLDYDPAERIMFFVFAFFATSFAGATAFVPALILVALAEAFDLRSVFYYTFAGLAIGAFGYYGSDVTTEVEHASDIVPVSHALSLAAASGIIGGFVYWMLAGRNAGRWKARFPAL